MERLYLLTITVCVGSSCYVRGSEKLAETLQRLVERESLGAGLSSPAPSAWNNVRMAFQSGWATGSTAASSWKTSNASFVNMMQWPQLASALAGGVLAYAVMTAYRRLQK
jgi:hypothetical protein